MRFEKNDLDIKNDAIYIYDLKVPLPKGLTKYTIGKCMTNTSLIFHYGGAPTITRPSIYVDINKGTFVVESENNCVNMDIVIHSVFGKATEELAKDLLEFGMAVQFCDNKFTFFVDVKPKCHPKVQAVV